MINAAVNNELGSRALFAIQHRSFVSQEGCMPSPPFQRHETRGSRNTSLECAVPGVCVAEGGGLSPSPATQNHGFVSHAGGSRLLCHTADTSAELQSSYVRCVTQQTCLLCAGADMSAVSHSRHVCCVAQRKCLLCRPQTCLLCDTTDMSGTFS